MKLRKTLAAAGALAIAGSAFAMKPASAVDDLDATVPVTFTLTGGDLTITMADETTPVALTGTATPAAIIAGTASLSAALPETTVRDYRTGTSGTTVSISADDFSTTGYAIPADNGTATVTGLPAVTEGLALATATAAGLTGVTLGTGGDIVTSQLGASLLDPFGLPLTSLGAYAYTFTASVSVDIPTSAIAGTYTSTVTQSVV